MRLSKDYIEDGPLWGVMFMIKAMIQDSGHQKRSGVCQSLNGRGQGGAWGDYLRQEGGHRDGSDGQVGGYVGEG